MEETEGPFDHFWGPLNVNDFETKPFFDSSHLIDNDMIRDVNCSLVNVFDHDIQHTSMKCESIDQEEEEEQLKCNITERRAERFCSRLSGYPSIIGGTSPMLVELPYLTIPPGISPAALLESPTMLPNSQQSPTTGTFPLATCDDDTSMMNSLSPARTDRDRDIMVESYGMFKTPGDFAHMPCTSSAREQPLMSSKVHAESSTRIDSTNFSNMEASNDATINKDTSADLVHQNAPLLRECIKVETKTPPFFEPEQKRILPSMKTNSVGDGYCWRKYGQKHVKGSEYPRSYYKCNNSNCLVKKKVERSHDGEITEIIYNGAHNHPKPHLRLSLACQATSNDMLDSCEVNESHKLDSWTSWRCNRDMNPNVGSDWIADGMEGTSSMHVLNEFCDPSSSNQEKSAAVMYGSMMQTHENGTAIVRQNGDDQDGMMMQGSTSPSDDESDPKRRKREMFTSEAYLPSRSTREPRIILQIESEIDVLEDGYRWRKYGQKVVKGNPNPRSYYKCTSIGCPVRKHVERASEDIKSVITTYEGKHNHEVPTATKTAGGASTVGHSPQNVSDATNHVFTLPRNPMTSNAQMTVQDFPNPYQMKPALCNEFSRCSPFLGGFVSDMKIGVPSIYPMKFPALQSPMLYNPFMRNLNGSEFQTPSFGTPLMHDLPMINASRSTNMNVSGIHPSNHSRPCGLVQSSVGIQQRKENDFRFFKPKEEQKE